jgi:hypothetical protein
MKGTAFVIGYARSRSGGDSGKRHEAPGRSIEQEIRNFYAEICELFHK